MSATLCVHAGARIVERAEVISVEPIQGTDTWFPTPHIEVLETVEATLVKAGFEISKSQYALSKDNSRFFGTLDLTSPIIEGMSLAIGVRNSCDKTFPISLTAGSRVFVCDNLAFNSDIYVSRRHTRNGKVRFDEGICRSMDRLTQFKLLEAKRMEHYQACELTEEQAASTLLHGYEEGILSTQILPKAIQEWRKPSFEAFLPRTAFSLFNAVTESAKLRQSNPQKFAALTMSAYGLIDKVSGFNVAAV